MKKLILALAVVSVTVPSLAYPATTDAVSLSKEMDKRHDATHMSVVFSTYHSIDVISKAQKDHNLADFDLIICDEAHRTTGATFDGEEESNFVKIHDANFIKGVTLHTRSCHERWRAQISILREYETS